jgi:hypothetical protein
MLSRNKRKKRPSPDKYARSLNTDVVLPSSQDEENDMDTRDSESFENFLAGGEFPMSDLKQQEPERAVGLTRSL